MFKLISLYILIFVSILSINNGIEINLPKSCKYDEKYPDYGGFKKALICKKFKSFVEIKLNVSFLNNTLQLLFFIPKYQIILDQSLDLSNMVIKYSID